MQDALAVRLHAVQRAIDAAAGARSIQLVAASKFQSDEHVAQLYRLGVHHFGENYPQALKERAEAFASTSIRPNWHLLGGLQRNKASLIAPHVDVIHSLDDIRVAEALNRAWKRAGRQHCIDVYVQIALDTRPTPHRRGVAAADVAELVAGLSELSGLRLVGLMALPPVGSDPATAFRSVRGLRDELCQPGGPLVQAKGLSMGMSVDFSLAIAEGATVVRIGSALFGTRSASR